MHEGSDTNWERAQVELLRLHRWVLNSCTILATVVLGVVISVKWDDHQGWALLLGLPVLLAFAWLHRVLVLDHRSYGFRLLDDGLLLRSGVWWTSEVFVPRARIQHTDVAQGPLARRLNLAKLVLHTAGVKLIQMEVVGLRPERARELRDELLQRALPVAGSESPAETPATP